MKKYLSLAVVIFFIGCAGDLKNIASSVKPIALVDNNQKVETSITHNEKIFADFGKMIEAYYGKKEIYIQSEAIENRTGNSKLLSDSSLMLKTAIAKIGRPLVYVDYGQNSVNINTRPKYVISGGITEYDEGIKIVDTSVKAGINGLLKQFTGDLQGESRKNSIATNMAVDLTLKDYETSKVLVYSNKKVSLFENKKEKKAGFYLFGTGLEIKKSVTYKSAKDATVRLLLEMATLELIGKELKLPYWKLTGAKGLKSLETSILEGFERSDKVRELQRILQKYGFTDIVVDGELNSKTKNSLEKITRNLNIRYRDINAKLLTDLWLNIPYKKELKYTPNEELLHYPNDLSVIAKQIDKLGYKIVQINSIVDVYTRNRNKFSNEFKDKLIKYLLANYKNLIVKDGLKTIGRGFGLQNSGLVNINGFFKIDGKKIVMEFKATKDNKVIKTIKETFTKNRFDTQALPSAKIAEYLRVKSEMKNDIIDVRANKEGEDAIYYSQEKIEFHLKLKKSLYLHIFNIDSSGNVADMLQNSQKYEANRVYIIPENSDDELVIKAPYGNDGIKFIAMSEFIAFPEDKKGSEIVDYFRNEAKNRGIEIFEKSLLVETKQR